MRSHGWTLLLAIIPLTLLGCGQTSGDADGEQAATANADSDAGRSAEEKPQSHSKPKLDGPAAAVYEFLEAVRSGDDATADQMLTTVARQKTQEMNMVVAPPGSDTARFQVGKAEILPDDRAKVDCTWTDRDIDGTIRTDEIIWVLRKETEGWRIGGMVATVFPDTDPVMLNFEDPEGMIRKQEEIKKEMDRRMMAARAKTEPGKQPGAEEPIRR